MTDFRTIVAEKELEWKAALNQQVALLEETLASRETELRDERKKAAQLTEDFKYNLRLVRERDEELAAMERENIVLKQQCLALEDKLSAMSVKHDEVAQNLAEESHSRTRLAEQWKSEQDSRERELQLIRHEHELELSRLKDEHQALRRQLEMENVRCKKELELQKRELLGSLDRRAEELRDDYANRARQIEKSLMDSELKCDLLDKEAASLRKSRLDLLNRLETCETEAAGLENRLAEAAARYESDIAVLENENERLQELTASLEANHRAALSRLEEKLAAAQADAARHDQAAGAAAARLKEERQAVRKQTADLLAKLHEAEASFQRKANDFDSDLRAKDAEIEKLNGQIEDLQSQLHNSKADVGRLFVDKDAEIDRLRRQLETTVEELNNRRADIDKYRHELETALARERDRESMQHQMQLDYQRKAGELEALQYEKSEGYIDRLTQAKNEALRELEAMQTTLAQKQTFIQSLLKDRETALQAMKEAGVVMPDRRLESTSVEVDQLAASERRVRELSQQNDSLKEIVKQMRLEMESLMGSQPQQKQQQQQPPQLHQQYLGDAKSAQEVSNALSKLRAEKTDLLAQCRKQQARIGHLESRLADCQAEQEAADTAAEQLRYQLSAQERHQSTESARLKRRLQEAEAQLDESQREADEYYKANIESGRLVERLQQEVLLLKASAGSGDQQRAGQRPGEVNFGAQELYIQQLQDEIASLRDRMRARQLYGDEAEAGSDGASESEQVSRLRAKLKMAANQIKKLAQENQALVDLSNRLRADLNKLQQKPSQPSAIGRHRELPPPLPAAGRAHLGEPIELESHSRRAVKDAVGDMTSKLAQLERMQYYLTREELAKKNSQQQRQQQQQQQQLQEQSSLGDSLPVKDTGGSIRQAEGLRTSANNRESLNLSSVGGESLRDVWRLLDSNSQQQPATGRSAAVYNDDEEEERNNAEESGDFGVASRNQALRSLQVRGRAAVSRRRDDHQDQ